MQWDEFYRLYLLNEVLVRAPFVVDAGDSKMAANGVSYKKTFLNIIFIWNRFFLKSEHVNLLKDLWKPWEKNTFDWLRLIKNQISIHLGLFLQILKIVVKVQNGDFQNGWRNYEHGCQRICHWLVLHFLAK